MNLKKKKRPSTPSIPKNLGKSAVSKKPWQSKAHRMRVCEQPCLFAQKGHGYLCDGTPSEPHHCRKLKPNGLLPRHDWFCIPLCRAHHKAMDGYEREIWRTTGFDPAAWIAAFSKEGRQAIEQLQHE